jgi:hypothetical protein
MNANKRESFNGIIVPPSASVQSRLIANSIPRMIEFENEFDPSFSNNERPLAVHPMPSDLRSFAFIRGF